MTLEIPELVLKEAHRILSETRYKFGIVDSKVYAIADTNVHSAVCGELKSYMETNIFPNTETHHITIVNSNIVHDCGEENVKVFVQKYEKEFDVKYGRIKSTISKDWAHFSKCYVVEIISDSLEGFVSNFNEVFGTKINPSFHVTFAILPRSLFVKS